MRPELERLALGCSTISFAGRLEGEELWSRLGAADVLLVPSRQEGWGLVVNEAMAAGLPVIVSDCVGCIDDLVIDSSGTVVQTGDITGMAIAMRNHVKQPEKRREQSVVARKIIAPWTTENWAKNITQAWEHALR